MTMLWSLFLFFFNVSFADFFIISIFSLKVALMVKNLPAMRGPGFETLGWEDPPGRGNCVLPTPVLWHGEFTDKGDQQATVPGVAKSRIGHD